MAHSYVVTVLVARTIRVRAQDEIQAEYQAVARLNDRDFRDIRGVLVQDARSGAQLDFPFGSANHIDLKTWAEERESRRAK